MRYAVCVIALFAAAAVAYAEPPATAPASEGDSRAAVYVSGFDSLADDADHDGAIARTVTRSLVAELGRNKSFTATQSKNLAADRAVALADAGSAGDKFAVWGQVQFIDSRIRITGEVLDVARGDLLGAFKTTGTLRDLFELEDEVAGQVIRKLNRATDPAPATREANADAKPQPRGPIEIEPSEPLRVDRGGRSYDPDWLNPPSYLRYGDDAGISWRYNFGQAPYWSYPYYAYPYDYSYGYSYLGYGGYHPSYYRPYRSLYQHRYYDYNYRGLPDRRLYDGFGPRSLRSFSGPVPMRWYGQR